MMQQMRENTKWIMLLTAAAFVALMVFEWGMDLSGQSSAALTGGEMGRVNGEPVTYEEYTAVYRNLYDQRQQSREQPITAAENRQIEEAAWNQVVMDHLVLQEIERRGIEVTDDEIRQAARYAPPPTFRNTEAFQTDGEFDLQKYHDFLASSAGNPQLFSQLEAYYRDALPRNKLYAQIVAGVHVTDAELWRMWRDRRETARVRYVAVDPATVVPDDSVSVTDAEMRAYYREHREEFTRPAQAAVRLAALDKTPTAEDSAAARERVARVRQEILDGAAFEDVAMRESADPTSAENGGDLGTVQRGQTAPAFEQAVWSLPIGRLSEPVLTQYGYHLIEVESRTDESADVRHILIPIERSDRSELRLLTRADSLEALGESVPLEAAAERMGLRVRTAELTEAAPFVPGVGDLVEGADWAFETAEPGMVSPVFESSNAFYMLELVERTPERVPALEEIEAAIRSRLVREEKREAARAIASAIGAAFGLEPGQTSGAVEANGRFFIVRALERSPADREAWEAQKDAQRAQVVQALQQQRIQQFLEGLREEADIRDGREQFYAAADAQQQSAPQQPGLF